MCSNSFEDLGAILNMVLYGISSSICLLLFSNLRNTVCQDVEATTIKSETIAPLDQFTFVYPTVGNTQISEQKIGGQQKKLIVFVSFGGIPNFIAKGKMFLPIFTFNPINSLNFKFLKYGNLISIFTLLMLLWVSFNC